MPTLTTSQSHTIEITALQGKAIASLLSLSSGADDCSAEDITHAAYALECLFNDILAALESGRETTIPAVVD